MPLPEPKNVEKEDEFISRCLGELTDIGEGSNSDQRLAICSSIWRKKMEQKSKETKKEFRAIQCEIRMAEDAENTLVGYAAKYNVWSGPLVGFRERIKDGAFDRAIAENQDVRALWNHDSNFILGRTKSGTLKLETDDVGLRVKITPPDTTWAKDLMSSIKRGDVNQMSFGFTVKDDKFWQEEKTGEILRELRDVDLFDVSPVTYPAYEQTEVFTSREKKIMSAVRKHEHGFELNKEEKDIIIEMVKKSESVDADTEDQKQTINRTMEQFAKQEKNRYEKIRSKHGK